MTVFLLGCIATVALVVLHYGWAGVRQRVSWRSADCWEEFMPDYRIYLVTEDNHIASAPVGIACDNDLSAVRQSQKFLDRHDIQLWQGRRLVTLLKGKCA